MSAATESDSPAIVPFWNRLPEMVRYPAHVGSMIVIVLLAVGHLLAFLPFGFVWLLLVTVAMYRYGFDCLLATADGQPLPPEVSVTDDSGLGWRLIGLIIVLFVAIALIARYFGKNPAIVAELVVVFALPAAIIILALEESVFRALNPAKWIAVMTRIGWPYLAAVGLALVVLYSERYAETWVLRFMPKIAAVIVVGIIANYALVVTFHLMGYLVFQYHNELGFSPSGPTAYGPLRAPDPDQNVLDEAADLVRDGNPAEATSVLRSHLRGRGGTPAVHDQYRKLLRLAGDNDGLLKHGHEYLNIALAQHDDFGALKVLAECQAIDPAFAPTAAADVTRLAQLAARRGQPELALKLLSGFGERFPESPDVVPNEFLAATIVHERMNDDTRARDMLRELKSRYPQNPLMPKIDERLALIDKMIATTPHLGPKHPSAP